MSTITTTNKKNDTSARQAAPKASAVLEAKPDLIRRRAYEIFLGRNGGPGDHISDWIQAEQELSSTPRVAPVVVRTSERRGSDSRAEVTSHPIRNGILDNR
jgi:hypothetical protein